MNKKLIFIALGAAFIAGGTLGAPTASCKTSKPATAKVSMDSPENKDTPTAKEADALVEKAQAGDADAQNTLGDWIYNGIYFNKDEAKAVKWWQQAAKHKNGKATASLAECYRTGTGVEKADSIGATKLYLSAFRFGNTDALKKLEEESATNAFAAVVAGRAYFDGAGVKKNIDKAIYYYHTAAKLGSNDVIYPLAEMTYRVKDYPAALKWFKKATTLKELPEKEQLASTYWYGKLLIDGASGTPEPDAGFPYIIKTAEKGLVGAQIQAARCYWDGIGTNADATKGYEWMLAAARQDNPEAQWEVAMAILDKRGVAENFPAAFEWMVLAADYSSINRFKKWVDNEENINKYPGYFAWLRALKALDAKNYDETLNCVKVLKKLKYNDYASYYEALTLIAPDYKKANQKKGLATLEKLAAANPYVNYTLVETALSGTINDYKPDMVKMLTQCIDKGWYQAYETLGNIYFEGLGVDKNLNKAILNYLKAHDYGVLSATGFKRLASCYENGWGVEKNPRKSGELLKNAPKDYRSKLIALIPVATK